MDAAANAPVAPVKHSGLELARANIDTPIEKIAMERGGQKAVDQVSSMAVGQTPRQLMNSYGGLFMSRAEPLFSSLGITRQDFEKAISMPQTKQDIKMRFFGSDENIANRPLGPESFTTDYNKNIYEATDRPTMARDESLGPDPNPFTGFRQSENVDDRRNEQLGRDQLAALKAGGFGYAPGPEVASSPLGAALGLGDLPTPRGRTSIKQLRCRRRSRT